MYPLTAVKTPKDFNVATGHPSGHLAGCKENCRQTCPQLSTNTTREGIGPWQRHVG